MDYYPKQALILEQTIIRRNRMLPPRAHGEVLVSPGSAVNAQQVVVRGEIQQDFRMYDMTKLFGINADDTDRLEEKLAVRIGGPVAEGQQLFDVKGRRGRRMPHSPAHGSVIGIDHGRLILQINPKPVEVHARMPGRVIDVIGNRGALIEAQVALVQCRWGNGKFGYSSFSFEPEEGLASYLGRDARLENIRGRVYILPRELTAQDLETAIKLGIDGLVAITMPHYLRELALMVDFPVLLISGFGKQRRISDRAVRVLREYEKQRQAAFDAYTPNRFQNDQPEIIIPLGSATMRGEAGRIFPPELRVGSIVRLTRAPFKGILAEVVDLPDLPATIDNGLHTSVARVKLETGDTQVIPLANVELVG